MSTPNFYCYPTFHNDPIWDASTATGLWLVTSQDALAPGPGVYSSWEVCSAVCEGVPGAGAVFYNTEADCYAAWHARCRLGEHDHPAEPQTPSRRTECPATDPFILQHLHFAVRGGETIYSDLGAALAHYQKVLNDGDKAELLATQRYMKALYFARGANEWTAERLAGEASPETRAESVVSALPHPVGGIAYPVSPTRAADPHPAGPTDKEIARANRLTSADPHPAGPTDKEIARANRLASIQASVKEMEEKKNRQAHHLTIISEYLASTPSKASSSKVSPSTPFKSAASTPSRPGPSTPSTPSKSARSPFKAAGLKTSSIKIGGRVVERTPKAKAPANGNESDTLYDALDDDLTEVLADWVDPDYRFDPRSENKPRDDA
ncbi:hypothetical protein C8F04DRAFT_1265179 [Mycena alexandri]|uniref:Uncharacterized protein n=1 Tax=Mycena alexandri TaxID=1745969 RepID=A0AAD6SJG6_9AGAR|nr:hypothetical protein C8F04DRAFT_1265179 [Mycena alexandri]